VIALATIIASTLVAVLAAWVVEPIPLDTWPTITLVLGSLLTDGSLGLLAGLLALLVLRWLFWLRAAVAIPLGAAHHYLWLMWASRTFESRLAEVALPLLPVWMLSGAGGLVVGLVLIPGAARRARLTHTAVVTLCSTILLALAGPAFVAQCLLGVILDDGIVQHTVPHPKAPITALVIRDDCGATCGCHMRVDLKTDHHYLREVYRGPRACDAEVSWQSPVLLHIQDDDGGERDLDIRTLGLSVP
jgi:hypothetical protein